MATLVTGANGQIGSELVAELARTGNVIATDLTVPSSHSAAAFEHLDVTDRIALRRIASKHRVHAIYHLASLLSVTSEKDPDLAWDVNVNGLRNVLDLARERGMKVFWPSSIAVFGRATPKLKTPQTTILDPSTIYGVTKVSGEFLCRYYYDHYGVDVRSLRFPGLVSYKTAPGGGTTDFAVEVFYAAGSGAAYECFVGPETRLPMMYMPDAIHGALELMRAGAGVLTVRTSYNVSSLSFTAAELVESIRQRIPDFEVVFRPDRRQRIADSWPSDVDDRQAREDWGWRPGFDLEAMVDDMLDHLVQAAEHLPRH
jgi:nucleoside-diphosphate-sugar epimerase